MYTRCPWCQTVFTLSAAQLEARRGLVRCGQCSKLFQADEHLIAAPPPAAAGKQRGESKAGVKTAVRSSAAKVKPRAPIPEPIPLINELSFPEMRPARAARAGFWIAGSVTLLLLLVGQLVYFFPREIAPAEAPWHPTVAHLCVMIGCDMEPRHDIRAIELVETQVAPHPQYDKSLRIRATLVNRSNGVLPFPLMEVSLTNISGVTVARRSFTPAEYLQNTTQAQEGMLSHVAVNAQLDITHPDRRALGYEIQLLPAKVR